MFPRGPFHHDVLSGFGFTLGGRVGVALSAAQPSPQATRAVRTHLFLKEFLMLSFLIPIPVLIGATFFGDPPPFTLFVMFPSGTSAGCHNSLFFLTSTRMHPPYRSPAICFLLSPYLAEWPARRLETPFSRPCLFGQVSPPPVFSLTPPTDALLVAPVHD